MRNRLIRDVRLILQEAAMIKRRLHEMPKGIARNPGADLRKTSIADLRARAKARGLDYSQFGSRKRDLLKAVEDAEKIDPRDVCSSINSFAKRIDADLTEPCVFYAPKNFRATYRSWNLTKDMPDYDEDEYYYEDIIDREAEIVSEWGKMLKSRLINDIGDVFDYVYIQRDEKNYVSVIVRLK